jgi:hypothetical protein
MVLQGYSFMLAAGNVVGAFGKIVFGVLADSSWNGKAVFLIATLGSAFLTILWVPCFVSTVY